MESLCWRGSLTSGGRIVHRQVVLVERSGQLQEALDQRAKGATLRMHTGTADGIVALMDTHTHTRIE